MTWTKTALPNDLKLPGLIERMQEQLYQTMKVVAAAGSDNYRQIALFSRDNRDNNTVEFFFSPACQSYAKAILAEYGAQPCERPNPKALATLVVDETRRDLLFA